ncbi:MAG: bifunctional diaminohydroxyphosphoribosylaminopyrimidine deaminase/5-amino-6-(5-phosphoribosylamino)uracil reductase RibD [Victivallaceae bacterium]|nr:bifunctional diaminohydroxyphosphoribosylaminopyrimidine deaminase/5-amino-6-(5-phosphoribosylamino)uracil reductase RibD [Victivallaceae bacterium]
MGLPDEKYMALALQEAMKAWGLTTPNPMVGAVAVKNGKVVGRAFHHRAGGPHAERELLRRIGDEAAGCTVYVNLEPCSTTGRTPPCTEALIEAKVAEVVIGSVDPNPLHAGKGIRQLEAAGINVRCGVLENECIALNRAFFKWIVEKKPFVLLKMAMTLDGKIADSTGDSKWITGTVARRRVQELRCWADAIMVTGKTLRADHPRLTVREPEYWPKKLRKFIAAEKMSEEEIRGFFPDDPAIEKVCFSGAAEFDAFLNRIGSEEVTSLLIEGGGELAGAALEWNMVDAVEFHIAPKFLCGRNSIPVTGGENRPLSEVTELVNMRSENRGGDLIVTADVVKK